MSDKITLHPAYEYLLADYSLLRTCYAGQRAIKDSETKFLSPTNGMKVDGYPSHNPGKAAYDAYRERAIFYSYLKESIISLLGTMYSKPPSFELPSSIQTMKEESTPNGEPLGLLLQRINSEQLLVGRVGVLCDVPESGGNPYLVTYNAESIIDWDVEFISGRNIVTYVCLDESGYKRTKDGWVIVESYRLLRLIDNVYQTTTTDNVESDKELEWLTPTAKGKPLNVIPFVFINTIDLNESPSVPPMVDLANLSISIYRQTADYNQSLFHQAQPTLVRTGASGADDGDKDSTRTGAGALVDLPEGGTLEYVEVSGAGLQEMRVALNDNKAQASVFTSAFLRDSGANSSGEALKVRLESASATLKNIALTGSKGLEQALSYCVLFSGGVGDQPVVSPNLDFSKQALIASELNSLLQSKAAGAPISTEQIHRYLQTMDFTNLTFEEVQEEIKAEENTETPVTE